MMQLWNSISDSSSMTPDPTNFCTTRFLEKTSRSSFQVFKTHHFAALKPTLRKESHMMPRKKLGARISCRSKVLRAYLSHTLQTQFFCPEICSFASGSMMLELKNGCKRTRKATRNPQEAFVCNNIGRH
jgi:hypothetical protein